VTRLIKKQLPNLLATSAKRGNSKEARGQEKRVPAISQKGQMQAADGRKKSTRAGYVLQKNRGEGKEEGA
jgi:hypothetical protein